MEEIEFIEEDTLQSSPIVFNQQNNNFHLNQHINPTELIELSNHNPSLANRYMDFYEKQQSHNINVDKEILLVEKAE